MELNQSKGVMFLAEFRNQGLAEINAELASASLKIARQLGEEVSAVLIGSGITGSAQELISLGVDKVYLIDNTDFIRYRSEPYLAIMSQICQELQPNVLLLGHTDVGRDLGPRLAFRLNTGLVSNCFDFEKDPVTGNVRMTRLAYGGKATGIFTVENRPQMATLGPKRFEPAPKDHTRQGEIISFPYKIDETSVKKQVVNSSEASIDGVKLEDAEIIVSGGRGIGSTENFEQLKELAEILGGCVGGSRAAIDNEWLPSNQQIGITGKVVSPNLYIAIGVSGSIQHMAGCSAAKTIIAINRDPEAHIFKMAHFGVVGDWKKILPPLIESYRTLRR